MKSPNQERRPREQGLSLRNLRELEQRLGVFLTAPHMSVLRGNRQQFGVWDEDEKFVGDIAASGKYYDASELETAIRALFFVAEVT